MKDETKGKDKTSARRESFHIDPSTKTGARVLLAVLIGVLCPDAASFENFAPHVFFQTLGIWTSKGMHFLGETLDFQ